MSGDYSRIAYEPLPNYHAVLLQQGRPLTDRDWNDLAAQSNRRMQAAALDALGRVAPSTVTPDAFAIAVDSTTGELTIAPGRMYVDGLLAENHGLGKTTWEWDRELAELRSPELVPFAKQPYLPDAKMPDDKGPYLVYLDVWQREVTQCEDRGLVEKALGVDTTTRLQTIWQVKLLDTAGTSISCATDNDLIPQFAPSAGRLTITTGDVTEDNPCLVPPVAGYKGLENQLYRIEVHDGGAVGKATFKWSRDNASVTTRVLQVKNSTTLVVESIGKDEVLGFFEGDWIEITDNHQELNGLAGDLRRIKIGGGVDEATRKITLEKAMSLTFPTVDADGTVDPDRHVRICRWDQKHQIRDDNDVVKTDLDLATSSGAIPVPATGVRLHIEHGIYASFDIDPSGGEFHVGDYWVTAARTSDATVDLFDKAPPRGIHHHYAKLAVFTPPKGLSPCITKPVEEQADCCCTVVASPDGDIQAAINSLDDKFGGCVCLKPGVHKIKQTLTITTSNVVLRGESPGVVIEFDGNGALLAIGNAGSAKDRIRGIEISNISFKRSGGAGPVFVSFGNVDDSVMQDCVVSGVEPSSTVGISINDSAGLRVERCTVTSVGLGILVDCKETGHDLLIAQNTIKFDDKPAAGQSVGILVMASEAAPIYRVVIANNTIEQYQIGVFAMAAIEVDADRNTIVNSGMEGSYGIICYELAFGRINGNTVNGAGVGCLCMKGVAIDIANNAMLNGAVGIYILEQVQPSCTRNRIGNMSAGGILMAGNWGGRSDILENRISTCGFAAFPNSGIFAFLILGDLHIKANEIVNSGISLAGAQNQSSVAGIAAFYVLETAVEGNLVTYVGAIRQFIADDRALLMLGFTFEFPALITGNKFTGWGQTLVQLLGLPFSKGFIIGFSSVFFNNNYCCHLASGVVGTPIVAVEAAPPAPAGTGTSLPATVMLTALSATVMGNQIKAFTPNIPSLLLWMVPSATIIGNITTGAIEADASALPASLNSLNSKI